MNDLEIKQFEAQLLNLINSINLPLEVKRLVIAETYNGLVSAVNSSVEQQVKAQNAAMQENQSQGEKIPDDLPIAFEPAQEEQ